MLIGIGELGTTLTATQQQIVSAAEQYGVPPSLALAVAQQESGFNPSAVSPAGAIGVMQLMPSTAASLGVDPSDPTQNIQGGVELLSQLLQQYGGNTDLALWAYNAGPGNVASGNMPSETAAYIPAVSSDEVNWASVLNTSPVTLPGGSSPASSTLPSSQAILAGDSSLSDVFTGDSGDDTVNIAGVDIPTSYALIGGALLAVVVFLSAMNR